jgi:iodotyrosine deiodinase
MNPTVKKSPYSPGYSNEEQIRRSEDYLSFMRERRSVRSFSTKQLSLQVIKNCVKAAATAPSGANMQPWTFIIIQDRTVKKQIREEAEAIEKKFYEEKISGRWRDALAPLGTNYQKPFLEAAPFLIAVFVQRYGKGKRGEKITHYFADASVGISTGILLTALHNAGLASLTYTPSPMNFVGKVLNRPENERPFMIVATGLPSRDADVPNIEKKSADEYIQVV